MTGTSGMMNGQYDGGISASGSGAWSGMGSMMGGRHFGQQFAVTLNKDELAPCRSDMRLWTSATMRSGTPPCSAYHCTSVMTNLLHASAHLKHICPQLCDSGSGCLRHSCPHM